MCERVPFAQSVESIMCETQSQIRKYRTPYLFAQIAASQPRFQPTHEIHPLMKNGDDGRPVAGKPDDIVVFAVEEPHLFRQLVMRP